MDQIDFLDKLADPLQFLKALWQHAPIGVQIYDPNGTSIYVNGQFLKMFGAAPPPAYNCLSDENAAKDGTLHLIHQAFAGKPSTIPTTWYDPRELSIDPEYLRRYTKKCAIEATFAPIFGPDKKVVNVLVMFRDVTAERYLEQERELALKERDDAKILMRSILDQTQAVIYIKDREGRMVLVNEQYCRIFAVTMDQVIGRSEFELMDESLVREFRKNDLYVLETGSNLEIEETATHADGSKHNYITLKFPIKDSAGAINGVCGISTDLTSYRSLKTELSRAKRMESMALLAGGVAHDFNNSLATILLVTETLLLQGARDDQKWRDHVRSIKSTAQSAATLTRQLLTIGSRQMSRPRNIDLGAAVLGNRNILDNAVGGDIRFDVDLQPALWPVHIDPAQVDQILTNLCFNARDAMPQGGTLTIGARNVSKAGKDFVELTVTDTGTGIRPEIIDRIFEPFFSTKQDSQRTGLGLATVYGIVQGAGGGISVESVPEQGSTFRILFPRGTEAPEPVRAAEAPKIRDYSGRETVLLVEDQRLLREVAANLLRERGYTVIDENNPTAALAAWPALAEKVDLIVTDIVMPVMSGLEMVQQMSKSHPRMRAKTLFVSAYSEKKLSDCNFTQESVHFLEKPYSANEFLAKIREILDA
jgi:two-component system cell cycle sensor histidine kinase/response regulator CckA